MWIRENFVAINQFEDKTLDLSEAHQLAASSAATCRVLFSALLIPPVLRWHCKASWSATDIKRDACCVCPLSVPTHLAEANGVRVLLSAHTVPAVIESLSAY